MVANEKVVSKCYHYYHWKLQEWKVDNGGKCKSGKLMVMAFTRLLMYNGT